MNILNWLRAHRKWSVKTFGVGRRTNGIIKHIQEELKEIKANPTDVKEWVDVVILALDGAQRAGYTSEQVIGALREKQRTNFRRKWPMPGLEDESVHHIQV